MAWYALSNLQDGKGMSWRAISDPSDAAEGERAVPAGELEGLVSPVWDANLQRPVSLQDWRTSHGDVPQGGGIGARFLGPALEGTFREPSNRIGSFGARLTRDLPMPSDEWIKIPFDEVLWDTGGLFDPRHGAFVAERDMQCDFSAGARVSTDLAVNLVRLDCAVFKNGSPDVVREGGEGSGYPQMRFRAPIVLGSGVRTSDPVFARTGDVFEVYARHNIGADASLSRGDAMAAFGAPSDEPQFYEPTAIYFMGTYWTI